MLDRESRDYTQCPIREIHGKIAFAVGSLLKVRYVRCNFPTVRITVYESWNRPGSLLYTGREQMLLPKTQSWVVVSYRDMHDRTSKD